MSIKYLVLSFLVIATFQVKGSSDWESPIDFLREKVAEQQLELDDHCLAEAEILLASGVSILAGGTLWKISRKAGPLRRTLAGALILGGFVTGSLLANVIIEENL